MPVINPYFWPLIVLAFVSIAKSLAGHCIFLFIVAPFDAIDLYIVITLVNPCPSNLKGGFLSQVIVIYFDPPDPNGISAFIVFHCYSPKSIQKVEGLKRKTDINRG
jgi:hypothetical protein